MSDLTAVPSPPPRSIITERRVLTGTLVGTAIEWYDFFIYASVAALVFGTVYFEPLGTDNAALAQLVALARSASVSCSDLSVPWSPDISATGSAANACWC